MSNRRLFLMINTKSKVDMDAFHKAMETYVPHYMGGWINNKTLLMAACVEGHVDVVRELVELYPEREHVFACDKDGWTALMYAAVYNQPECVKAVCAAVPDPELLRELIRMREGGGFRWTALMMAASRGCADVVEMLLKMCPSAIEDTCADDSTKTVEDLIFHGDTEKTRAVFAKFWEKKRRVTKGISIATE